MTRSRARRNPPLPSAPPKRRFQGGLPAPTKLASSLSRVRKMSASLDERDRPFSPERPGSWQGSSRDLVVNPRSYEIRRVHKIAPRDSDRETATLPDSAFSSKTALADALRKAGILSRGQRLREFRVEGDKVIAFPEGGSWHSLIIDMDSAGNYTPNPMRSNSHLVVLTEEDFEELPEAQRKAWGGYTYKMTYETWDEEALEAGDTDDKGWEEEGSEPYESLKEVLRAARDHNWLEWSDSNPSGRSWLVSEDEEDMRTGDRTHYSLWIQRVDGEPLSEEEIDYISEAYGISGFGRMRKNVEQTRFKGFGVPPELQMPTFGWRQIGGDVNPGSSGSLIARADGDRIDLIEIQPVRDAVGDGEAAEVGFPFWTKEATYDLDDLSLDKDEVKRALQYTGFSGGEQQEYFEEKATPDQRVLIIAESLMSYGYAVDEGPAGWSKDIVPFPVEWWGGTTATFEEYCGDEDDEFRRDVLDEEDEED